MSDYNELKALAELACPGPWVQENDDLYFDDDGYTRHMMSTDSGHDVCDDQCCDHGHRDNLKFIASANPKVVLALITENESLRKDAARFAYIEQDADSGMSKIYGDDWIAVIDAAISSPENPS